MATKKTASAKRTRVKNAAGKFFSRRKSDGKFKAMDEVGRALTADRKQAAKETVKSGQGDKGDQKRSRKAS